MQDVHVGFTPHIPVETMKTHYSQIDSEPLLLSSRSVERPAQYVSKACHQQDESPLSSSRCSLCRVEAD